MIVYLDLETNFPEAKVFQDLGQLAIDRVTCMVFTVIDGDTEYTEVLTDVGTDNFTFFRQCTEQDNVVFVGHNICRFDGPIMQRLFGMNLFDHGRVQDTLLMSKIMYPERPSHSLDSWYKDFGMEKRELSVSLGDMVARCREDVQVTRKLYEKIRDQSLSQGMTSQCFEIESQVARIVAEQHERGVAFNATAAKELHAQLSTRMQQLAKEVADIAGLLPVPENKLDKPPKIQFKKDGSPSVSVGKYIERNGWELVKEEGWVARKNSLISIPLPLTKPLNNYRLLDIGSSDEVKEYLLALGWKPTIWNHKMDPETRKKIKTSPKLHGDDGAMCPGLDSIPGAADQVTKIKEYLTIRNRRNVLASDSGSGWLNHTRVQREGLIGSDADTVGAVTGRFTHRVIANIPRASSAYGTEIRGLFTARDGYVMVGWDASSLEARMEAHYTHAIDGGAYGEELLAGDIHTKNQMALGLPTRAQAKTFKYAVTYGASAGKLASQFGWTKAHAEEVFDAFWNANPALKELHRRVQVAAARGYLVAIDRRRIPVESMHSALNRLFQSAGAITMKYAMVIADKTIKSRGFDAHGLIRYHDEEQWEAREDVANAVGELGIQSIVSAGTMLKLNVPLTGEYKVGQSWADTH